MRTPTRVFGATAIAAALFLGGSATVASAAAPAPLSVKSVGSVCYSALPSQAHDTLDLISEGGPFPYPQDGTVFQNREHLLPSQSTGYYHEYTVITPGSPDRGARRIIAGQRAQEDYYTSDHYASFRLVDFGC